jgi:hypothetical protein
MVLGMIDWLDDNATAITEMNRFKKEVEYRIGMDLCMTENIDVLVSRV